jgi:methionine sulfoxide reductase heme-binding subunit
VKAPLRHAVVLAATLVLVWIFGAARDGIHPVHQWNRAAADAAVVLAALLFVASALARIWPPAAKALPWRRELGIYSVAAAVVHVAIYAQAFDFDLTRFFTDRHGKVRKDVFAAANWVGLAAVAFAAIPLITSNNLSQRLLGPKWKRLQTQSHQYWILGLLHAALFLWLVYPDAGIGGWLVLAAAIGVTTLQASAVWKE